MKKRSIFSLILIPLIIFISIAVMSCSFKPGEITGYGLFYSVEDYPSGNELYVTNDDSLAMYNLFQSKGYNVTRRIDSDATLANFITDINNLSSIIKPSDNFVFYFSGHGGGIPDLIPEENTVPDNAYGDEQYRECIMLYLSDADFNTALDYAHTTFDYESLSALTLVDFSLREQLNKINTKNIMVIIDACKSGGFVDNDYTTDLVNHSFVHQPFPFIDNMGDAFDNYFSGATADDTTIYLTAAGELEDSFESSALGNGFFTYSFVEYYDQADFNMDSFISAYEIYDVISTSMVQNINPILINDGNANTNAYHPHITGNGRDFVLFSLD